MAARSSRDVAAWGRRGLGFVASTLVAGILSGPASGCASAPPGKAPRIDAAALAREADAEVDRGCYLCLRSAAEKYEAAITAGAGSLDLAAAGAWTLVAVRERELGLRPSDALERARRHAFVPVTAAGQARTKGISSSETPNAGEVIGAYVRITSTFFPLRSLGPSVSRAGPGRRSCPVVSPARRRGLAPRLGEPVRDPTAFAGTRSPSGRP